MHRQDRPGGVPPLSRAILSLIASDWPAFADVRAAARALSQKSRLVNALSIAVNEVRVALAAALLCSDLPAEPEPCEDVKSRAEAVRRALRLYSHARAIISDCTEPLAVEWKLSEPQIGKVRQAFESVVGGTGSHPPIPPAPVPTSPPRPEEETFAQSVHLFLAAAIAQGLPAAGAMEAFGTLGRGSFSHDDKCFYPESAALGPIADRIGLLPTARRLVVSGCEGEGDTTVFLLAGAVAAIVSDKALRAAWADGPLHGQ
jgi:hypothetical protein